MMSGGGLLLGGRIADLLPRRRVFLTGLACSPPPPWSAGSPTTPAELIAARAVQGLSAALLTPSALSLIMTTYAGAQRKTAASPCGARSAASASPPASCSAAPSPPGPAGSSSSGSTSPSASSPSLVGLKVLAEGRHRPRRPRPVRPARRRSPSSAASAPSSTASPAPPRTAGCRSATLVAFAASAVLLAAFVRIERRAARPLVPPHTWKLRTLVSGTTVMLGVTGLLVGTVFLTSIFFQTVLGYSALRAGLAFLPFALAITAGTHARRQAAGHDVAAQHRRRRARPRRGRRRPAVHWSARTRSSRPTCCPACSSSGSASAWCSSPSR